MLYVGYSHPVAVEPPDGISFEVDTKTRQIKVKGFDKEQVGQVAANIREVRPPSRTRAKVSTTSVRKSAARLGNLVRQRSKVMAYGKENTF